MNRLYRLSIQNCISSAKIIVNYSSRLVLVDVAMISLDCSVGGSVCWCLVVAFVVAVVVVVDVVVVVGGGCCCCCCCRLVIFHSIGSCRPGGF